MTDETQEATISNDSLTRTLREVIDLTENAQTKQDLDNIIKRLKKLPSPVAYDDSLLIIILGLAFVIIAFAYFKLPPEMDDSELKYIMLFSFIAIPSYYMRVSNSREKLLDKAATTLLHRAAFLANNLREEPVDPIDYACHLSETFTEFNRGEHSEITRCLRTNYEGEEHSIDFQICRLEYIPSATSRFSETHGGYRTHRRLYDDENRGPLFFARHSLIFPFDQIKNLHILENKIDNPIGEKWKTASIEFNDRFSVYTEKPETAATFLKPKIIETLLKISDEYEYINLEFSSDNQACLSFMRYDVLFAPKYQWDGNMENLIKNIENPLVYEKLERLFGHVHTLMKYNDSNFS